MKHISCSAPHPSTFLLFPAQQKLEVKGNHQAWKWVMADVYMGILVSKAIRDEYLSFPSSWQTTPLRNTEEPREQGSLAHQPHVRSQLTPLAGAKLEGFKNISISRVLRSLRPRLCFAENFGASTGKGLHACCCRGGQGSGRGEPGPPHYVSWRTLPFVSCLGSPTKIKYCETALSIKLWLPGKKPLENQECESLPTPVSNCVAIISFVSYKTKKKPGSTLWR